jgi:hypothetical protein
MSRSWPGSRGSPSFEEIEGARAVYAKVLEVQRAIREPHATRRRVAPLMRIESPSLSGDELEESANEQGGGTRS